MVPVVAVCLPQESRAAVFSHVLFLLLYLATLLSLLGLDCQTLTRSSTRSGTGRPASILPI
jgi:hypothetical protein